MKNPTGWLLADNRYAACFDIMGFKQLIKNLPEQSLYELMVRLTKHAQSCVAAHALLRNGSNKLSLLRMVQFSDTIFIFSRDSSEVCREALILACRDLFVNSIENGILLRGAWARGVCAVDFVQNVFCGQPIVDAFLEAEDQMWFGAIEHDSARYGNDKMFGAITEYAAPLKSGVRTTVALNWPASADSTLVQKMIRIQSRGELTLAEYRRNTLAFAEYMWRQTNSARRKSNRLGETRFPSSSKVS